MKTLPAQQREMEAEQAAELEAELREQEAIASDTKLNGTTRAQAMRQVRILKERLDNRHMPRRQPEQYLTLAEIAERAGITVESARTYHKRATGNREANNPRPGDLPPEDIRLGQTPGWRATTIDAWMESRPRRTAQLGLPADDEAGRSGRVRSTAQFPTGGA